MQMSFRIADRRVAVQVQGTMPMCLYEAFLTHRTPGELVPDMCDLVLRVTPKAEWTNAETLCETKFVEELQTVDGAVMQVDVPEARGLYSYSATRWYGEFDINGDGIFGLFVTMRIGLALLLERNRGILLHSSGVWQNGKVWLFSGPSGVGKTTIAVDLKASGYTFSEDEIALEFDDSGRLIAHATPFGETRTTRDCPNRAEVAGICFVSQAAGHKLSKTDTHHAAKSLFRESRWYVRDPMTTRLVLETIGRIIETGVCYDLEFAKDPAFWGLLVEEVPF